MDPAAPPPPAGMDAVLRMGLQSLAYRISELHKLPEEYRDCLIPPEMAREVRLF